MSVTVLNGNGVSGAAAAEASRVRARGYKIGVVGNAPRGGYGRTIVMYRPGLSREGSRLAQPHAVRVEECGKAGDIFDDGPEALLELRGGKAGIDDGHVPVRECLCRGCHDTSPVSYQPSVVSYQPTAVAV